MDSQRELTVTECLNVMEKAHKTIYRVLRAHGLYDDPVAPESERKDSLEELKRVCDVLIDYR